MKIPFTIEQFLDVFKNYNLSVWPMQMILYLFAFVVIIISIRKNNYSNRIIAIILSILWLWMGIIYHLVNFSSINKAAYIFGFVYIIQALLFLFSGVIKSNLSFKYQSNIYGIFGSIFILYALVLYPILGYFYGHVYPKAPTFGVPCPTTIFTFGILLWTDRKIPKHILIIPLLWSVIGFSAAMNLNIKEDFGLFIAGVLGFILLQVFGTI